MTEQVRKIKYSETKEGIISHNFDLLAEEEMYLSEVKKILKGGDTENAIKLCKEAADKGDTDAMIKYALCLEEGWDGQSPNLKEATNLYKKVSSRDAITEDISFATYKYALCLENGIGGVEKNEFGALSLYTKINLVDPIFIQTKKKNANEWFHRTGNDNDPHNIFMAAICLELGLGTPKNHDNAIQFYKKAADAGDVDAMFEYACKTKYRDKRKEYYKKAADAGHVNAMFEYADIIKYESESDVKEMKEYYKMAADRGHDYAKTSLLNLEQSQIRKKQKDISYSSTDYSTLKNDSDSVPSVPINNSSSSSSEEILCGVSKEIKLLNDKYTKGNATTEDMENFVIDYANNYLLYMKLFYTQKESRAAYIKGLDKGWNNLNKVIEYFDSIKENLPKTNKNGSYYKDDSWYKNSVKILDTLKDCHKKFTNNKKTDISEFEKLKKEMCEKIKDTFDIKKEDKNDIYEEYFKQEFRIPKKQLPKVYLKKDDEEKKNTPIGVLPSVSVIPTDFREKETERRKNATLQQQRK
ncbi:MAG: hypothetical protein Ta2D_02400 [Rickettsiales bacterium]|nr:MAG: hypothetical protein Ta2D_02400 [Rickettsiales bacterium]